MQLLTNLTDPDDIRASMALLTRLLASPASSNENLSQNFAENLVDNVWHRIGNTVRRVLRQQATYADWTTIETLAGDLERPYRSVRSSLNGPLARAHKSAKQAVPGAPSLIEWRKRADGLWEF